MTEEQVLQVLRSVYDPEIGVNIVDLGLVYHVEVRPFEIYVLFTMTTPACPLSGMITRDIEQSLHQAFPEVVAVTAEQVWEPLWSPEMMSEEAREQLGWG